MRNVSYGNSTENQNTHFVFNNTFFFFENLAIHKVMWGKKIFLKRLRPQGHVIRRMHVANLISVQTHTHTHTQNMKCVLVFYVQNSYTNAPEYYVFTTLPVVLLYVIVSKLSKQLVCVLLNYIDTKKKTDCFDRGSD